MPYVDYFCTDGLPEPLRPVHLRFEVPNDHPYEVINETLKIMNEESAGLRW